MIRHMLLKTLNKNEIVSKSACESIVRTFRIENVQEKKKTVDMDRGGIAIKIFADHRKQKNVIQKKRRTIVTKKVPDEI